MEVAMQKVFVVDSTDARMIYLSKELTKLGYEYTTYPFSQAQKQNIYCFSPSRNINYDELSALADGSIIFCNRLENEQVELLKQKNIKYFNLMLDEKYVMKNALLTAEATLMMIIRNTPTSIFEQKLMICGFGRVAKTLAKLFYDIRLNFAVCARSEKAQAEASLLTKNVFDINNLEFKPDVIINTVPAVVLHKEYLGKLDKSCYILDLASLCGVEDSQNIELYYEKAPSLPAKFMPQTAGKIMCESIFTILNGVE